MQLDILVDVKVSVHDDESLNATAPPFVAEHDVKFRLFSVRDFPLDIAA